MQADRGIGEEAGFLRNLQISDLLQTQENQVLRIRLQAPVTHHRVQHSQRNHRALPPDRHGHDIPLLAGLNRLNPPALRAHRAHLHRRHGSNFHLHPHGQLSLHQNQTRSRPYLLHPGGIVNRTEGSTHQNCRPTLQKYTQYAQKNIQYAQKDNRSAPETSTTAQRQRKPRRQHSPNHRSQLLPLHPTQNHLQLPTHRIHCLTTQQQSLILLVFIHLHPKLSLFHICYVAVLEIENPQAHLRQKAATPTTNPRPPHPDLTLFPPGFHTDPSHSLSPPHSQSIPSA